VRPATPTLRSIAATTPSNNPYRPPAGSSMTPPPLQPEPLRALPRPSRPVAPACCRSLLSLSFSLSLSLSNTGLTRTPPSPGRRPWPAHRRLHPGCLPARRRLAGAWPLHRFLDHQPRHRQPTPPASTPSTATRPGLASPGPRPVSPRRCCSPPLAAPPPDSLHRPTPDAARLP
jgi:hypothetical protein